MDGCCSRCRRSPDLASRLSYLGPSSSTFRRRRGAPQVLSGAPIFTYGRNQKRPRMGYSRALEVPSMTEEQNGRGGWGARVTPYDEWQKREGIPIYRGSHVPDLHTADVAPWPRIGQKGAFVNLANQQQNDGWVMEIAPGGQTEVLHHLFE